MPKKFLAVEGKDEVNFFEKWLEELELCGVIIKPVGGKDKFKNEFPALIKSSEFEDASILAIVRDADGNPKGAFDSVCHTLEKAKIGLPFSIPQMPNKFSEGTPRIGIFIIENELEDLCLKSLKCPEVEPCLDAFFTCLPSLKTSPKKMSKARLQAYLSAMEEHCESLGVGAQKGYFNFESNALALLKEFLLHLKQAD